MSNKILFISSILCSIVHFYFIFYYFYKIYYYMYVHVILSLYTSILNHYSTSCFYKWWDRITIFISVIIDYNLYKETKYLYFLYMCVIFYFLEKLNVYKKNCFHILSHIFGTIFHCSIYKFLEM